MQDHHSAQHVRFARGRTVRADLRANTIDGVLYSISVGMGETYFAKFVHELGLGPVAVGLILTVPVLLGAALQTIGPPIVRRAGSFRGWVVGTAAFQAAVLLPIIALSLLLPPVLPGIHSLARACELNGQSGLAFVSAWALPAVIFGLISMYWGAGLATSPAWNAWTGLLIPRPVRGHFFGIRTLQCQLGIMLGLLIGGWMLERAASSPSLGGLTGFAIVFGFASLFRFGSAYYLSRYSEPKEMPRERRVPVRVFISRVQKSHDGRFLAYVLAVMFSAQIAQPFFNPYMFDILRVSTADYSWLIAGPILGRVVAAPLAGMVAKRRGPRKCLEIGGIAIVPMSIIWMMGSNFWWLLFAQVLTGAIWAMFEMGQQLLNFDALHQTERSSLMTKFILTNEVARTSGSLLGGKLLDTFQASAGGYAWVFWASTAARAAAIVLLLRLRATEVPRESRGTAG